MLAGVLNKKKNGEFLQLRMVKSKLTVGGASAIFENLFNGDNALSEAEC